MRKSTLFAIGIIFITRLHAQQFVNLDEGSSYKSNGVEYGYSISNEQSKEVKGEDYDRFEVSLYVTNNSGCARIIPFRPGFNPTSDEAVILAEFACQNATGKRLTAKGGKIQAKPWFTQVKLSDEKEANKFRFVNAQAGYAISNGQTLSTKIIVIVPKGERPKITCRALYLPEL